MCFLQKTLVLCTKKNLLQSAAISRTFIHKPNQPVQSSNFIFITRYSIFTIKFVPAYMECSDNDRAGFWRRPPQLICTDIKLRSHKVHLQSPTGRHGYVAVQPQVHFISPYTRYKSICKFVHETPL